MIVSRLFCGILFTIGTSLFGKSSISYFYHVAIFSVLGGVHGQSANCNRDLRIHFHHKALILTAERLRYL